VEHVGAHVDPYTHGLLARLLFAFSFVLALHYVRTVVVAVSLSSLSAKCGVVFVTDLLSPWCGTSTPPQAEA
jgi:hypothetical protein